MIPHSHNLLGPEHMPDTRRRRALLKGLAIGLGAAVALTAIAAVLVVVPSLGTMRILYANAQAGRADLLRAKDAGEALKFDEATSALSDAITHFGTAEDAANRLGILAKLPIAKENVAAARDLLEGGKNAAEALKEAIAVGSDLFSVFQTGAGSLGAAAAGEQRPVAQLTQQERRALLQKLSEAPDRLGLARDALDRALAAFDRVPRTAATAGVLDALAPEKQKLQDLRGLLSQDLSLLSTLPTIVGYPTPKTYLFLLLNNTELRPGGGFVGTYGVVRVADGDIESFQTDNVYALDGPSEQTVHETPPDPIRKYLKTEWWFMRDANWSPDFAVSALDVERFYRLESGEKGPIDGVIGITPTVISNLLAVTGPITVDGTTFNKDNVTDELEYQVEKGFAKNGVPYEQRKGVVGDLGAALVAKLLSTPIPQLTDLLTLAQDAISGKQLMLHFEDPKLQADAEARGWAGRLNVPTGDSLAVIDANLASLKSDPAVQRTIAYSLRPDPSTPLGAGSGSWIARAAVTYKHTGTFNWKTTRYRTYTRFYVPIGSTFLKGEGMMLDDKLNDPGRHPGTIDVGQDLGRTVFGGFISIEPGESKTLAVEYRVSDAMARQIAAGTYSLDVQKELGASDHGLTLDLDFGKNVVRAAPPEDPSEWGDTRYRLNTDLRMDRTFTVDLAK